MYLYTNQEAWVSTWEAPWCQVQCDCAFLLYVIVSFNESIIILLGSSLVQHDIQNSKLQLKHDSAHREQAHATWISNINSYFN